MSLNPESAVLVVRCVLTQKIVEFDPDECSAKGQVLSLDQVPCERSWIHGLIRLSIKFLKPNPMPCGSIYLSWSEILWTPTEPKLRDNGKLFDWSIVDHGRPLSVFLAGSVDISDWATVNQGLCRPFWIIQVLGDAVRCRIAWARLAG
jgi:hypothetical protein